MPIKCVFKDLNNIEYKEAWEFQEKLFDELLEIKKFNEAKDNLIPKAWKNYLLFCEHPHVYTLGQNGNDQNLLLDMIQLQAKNATFFKTNRGGDITYHGPGQIVGYPILNLNNFSLGIKSYIEKMEEVLIQTLLEYGIKSERLKGATGVWLDTDNPNKVRKIAAIGVRASHYITMHGFAFNINTDLNYFNYINPCGIMDKGVTSLEKELGEKQDIEKVKMKLTNNFEKIFDMHLIK